MVFCDRCGCECSQKIYYTQNNYEINGCNCYTENINLCKSCYMDLKLWLNSLDVLRTIEIDKYMKRKEK